jgi:hypothetical protein
MPDLTGVSGLEPMAAGVLLGLVLGVAGGLIVILVEIAIHWRSRRK